MRRNLVAVFETRRDADAARTALLEQGLLEHQIGTEGRGTSPSDARGLVGLIDRMLGGVVRDDDPRVTTYSDAVGAGSVLLVAHGIDDDGIERASTALLQHGALRVDPYPDQGRTRSRGAARTADPKAQQELAAVSSVGGLEVYVLPNAPTGWNRARTVTELSSRTDDPARPEGELRDAIGLDPEADRDALERAVKRRG